MNMLRRHGMLATIVALSVIVRIIYFVQLQKSPCIWQHRWTQSDMFYFDQWGQAIAAGDWLSKTVSVPMHNWHVNIAMEHLNRNLAQLTPLHAKAAEDPDPDRVRAVARALWSEWLGKHVFYQDPLYSYLTGIIYAILNPDPGWVFLFQMLAGVTTTVLIFLIARFCFGPAVAGIAGLLAALYSPALYYELVLVRESLITMMSLLLAGLTLLILKYRQRHWWFLTGIVLGIAILLKSTFILLGLGLTAGLTVKQWRERQALMPSLSLLVIGLILALSPLVARNLLVGASPFSLASGGINTLIFHNAEDYDARIASRAEFGGFHVSRHGARIMGKSHGKLLPAAIETLRTHTPSSYLSQLGHKLACVWHWYEIPNNSNYYFYRLHAWILHLPITFAVIGPLGLAGLLMGIPGWRKTWPLYLLVCCLLFPLLFFYTSSRLRLPLVTALIPFSALTIFQTLAWIRARRFWPAGVALGAITVAALVINRPLPNGMPRIRHDDFQVAFDVYYYPRIQQSLDRSDLPSALAEYRRILTTKPTLIREISSTRQPQNMAEAKIVNFFAMRFHEYGLLLAMDNQGQESKLALARANELGNALQPFSNGAP